MGITTRDLKAALGRTPEANRLAAIMDRDGNGVVDDRELNRAFFHAQLGAQPQDPVLTRGGILTPRIVTETHDAFEKALGPDYAAKVPDAEAFKALVEGSKTAGVITTESVYGEMYPICKDPEIRTRDATDPVNYKKSAEYVANKMKEIGLEPAGDGNGFLQSFWWEPTFGSDKTPVQSWNVSGMLRGAPRKDGKPNETVVVIGHLDNLSQAERDHYLRQDGRDLSDYEGACDNASAVVSVLEIARAAKTAADQGRPLEGIDLWVLVPSGEEDGLKGSEAAVRNPPVPIESIKSGFNFEMTGWDEHLVYGGPSDVIGDQNPLLKRIWDVAKRTGGKLVNGPANDAGEGWWRRSDHFPFFTLGIPMVMILGKPPQGFYHFDTDKLENVSIERIRDGAQLVYRTIVDLANDPNAPEQKRPGGSFTNHYGGKVWAQEERPEPVMKKVTSWFSRG